MDVKITSGVEIPPVKKTAYKNGKRQRIINQMEAGQSIHKLSKDEKLGFYIAASRMGVKMATRQMPDGTFSVWRMN